MVRRILSLRALFKKLSCMFCAGFSILAPKPSRASKTVLKNGFCIVTRFVGTMPRRARLAVRDLEVAGLRSLVPNPQGGFPILEGARKKPTARAVATGRERKIPREGAHAGQALDRKSTRLNSSHLGISYAVFCLK